MRYLLYSHDGLGLGHVRRNLAIAAALLDAEPTSSVLLATGVGEVEALGVPRGADVVRMPALRKVANNDYAPRRLSVSREEIARLRSQLLLASVEAYQPTVLLTDKHPLGVCRELRPALDALRAAGGRAALGVRDILDRPDRVRAEWEENNAGAAISRYYDRVLVYGQREVYDPVRAYGWSPDIAARTRFCGYVTASRPSGPVVPEVRSGPPVVLATVGGGADGFPFLASFLAASSSGGWDTIVVAGPHAAEDDVATVRRMANQAGARCHVFVPGLADWFAGMDALVCMGGYNTLIEALSVGTPTVCIPRSEPRAEQLLRARAFARLGLLRMIDPADAAPEHLRANIEAAIGTSRAQVAARVATTLHLDGARQAADALVELSRSGRRDELARVPDPV